MVYRCKRCGRTYNLYTGTVFEQHHLTPPQVALLLRGIRKGESTRTLAAELGLNYVTVLRLRHEIQARAADIQPEESLPDTEVEADEMFQNAGKKGNLIETRKTHPGVEGIADGGMGLMITTGHRFLGWWVVKVGRSGCGWCGAPMRKR